MKSRMVGECRQRAGQDSLVPLIHSHDERECMENTRIAQCHLSLYCSDVAHSPVLIDLLNSNLWKFSLNHALIAGQNL